MGDLTPLDRFRRTAALVVVALLAGLVAAGVPAAPASAACASPNRSIGGSFVGEDGRQISGFVGIVLLDSAGRSIGMDGCPLAISGYTAFDSVNPDPSQPWCCFSLPTEGATSGYETRWQIDGIPSNAAQAFVEAYPKSRTPDTTGFYASYTDYRRYGGALRRYLPISTSVDFRLPLHCGLGPGGDSGSIEAVVLRNGAPAPVFAAVAFSNAPENAGQILGFVASNDVGSGRFTIPGLEPNQAYALEILTTDGGRYWFEHNYGTGVPVQACTTTTRTFVLSSDGYAYVTDGGFRATGLSAVDVGGVRSVYTRGGDGAVYQRVEGGGPIPVGGQIQGDPDVASWGPGRADVVVRGADNQVYWRAYTGTGWAPWVSLGGGTGFSPSVVSWAPNRLDVVITGLDGQMWHKWSGNSGGSWSSWSPLGGRFTSGPDIAAWGVNRLDIVARGLDGAAWHRAWAGAWQSWESLGGRMAGGPGASSAALNRLDIVVRGADDGVYALRWTGGTWVGWSRLSAGVTVADPDIAAAGGRTTVYVRGGGGTIWRASRNAPDGAFGGWEGVPA